MSELNNDTITFGKFKGKTLQDILKDRPYCEWLLTQDFFQVNYEYLYNRVKEYDPKSFFLLKSNENQDFFHSYKYFNLLPLHQIKLNLTHTEQICYTFYLQIINELRIKIQNRIQKQFQNPFDIKAPVKWLQKFENQYHISRNEFKSFINSYELPNIPYIIEDIKKQGGIIYKGAKSYNIAKQRSNQLEKWWEIILKQKYGEDLGTQYKYQNCIFDFINISTNTIFECKLALKDFNEEQHKKYLLTLGSYKIIYLIDKDCVINIQTKKIYTTNPDKYTLYILQIPLKNQTTKFDDIIINYTIKKVKNLSNLFGLNIKIHKSY